MDEEQNKVAEEITKKVKKKAKTSFKLLLLAFVKMMIKPLLVLVIITFIGASFLKIVDTIKNTMIGFSEMGNTTTSKGILSKLWSKLTGSDIEDYWIDLDAENEYIINNETGETIGLKGKVTDEEIAENYGVEKKFDIVERYVRDLGLQGISIKALRLLGDTEYLDIDEMLKNKEDKELVEKYISEFIRADIITQHLHRTSGVEVVSSKNQNLVDGGIFLYRTKEQSGFNDEDFQSGNYTDGRRVVPEDPVDNLKYVQMTYMEYEDFINNVDENQAVGQAKAQEMRYKFSINPDTENLVIVKFRTEIEVEEQLDNKYDAEPYDGLYDWISDRGSSSTTYYMEIVEMPYAEKVVDYAMPYEFLINLCEITQNPEFVYHVALLARDTQIVLAIHDEITMNSNTVEEREERTSYSTGGNMGEGLQVYVRNAGETGKEKSMTRKTKLNTDQTPILEVEYADAWNRYDEFSYTKNIDATLTEEQEGRIHYDVSGNQLSFAADGRNQNTDIYGNVTEGSVYGHYAGTFTTEYQRNVQDVSVTTHYNEPIQEKAIMKSKQFLGLLRNEKGECPEDCYQEAAWKKREPTALTCAREAVFERDGTNVSYKIPNMTRKEMPLNRLKSGIKILYSMLDGKIDARQTVTQSYDGDNDYASQYVNKMQALAEYIRYIMTFPDNEEDYTIKQLDIDKIRNIFEEDEEEEIESEDILGAVEWVHKYVRENGYTYAQAGISVPNYKTKTIDCSSYVTWAILHTGYRSSRFYEGMYQWTSYTFEDNPEGWQEISSFEDAKAGDILVYNGHVEIYAGGGTNSSNKPYVFSCGSNTSINYKEAGYSGHTTGQLTKILRIKGVGSSKSKYNLTGEQLDVLYAVVAQECSADYDGALAVITCILNRCTSSKWSAYGGSDPYKQATAPSQFCYSIDNYWRRYLNGKAPSYVVQAVNDALGNGKRNHNYTSFRTNSETTRRNHPDGENIGGNWYF